MKLRIFSDRSLVGGSRPVDLLYAFWGEGALEEDDPDNRRYEHYVEVGREFFELTDLASADLAVYPVPYSPMLSTDPSFGAFLGAARTAGKRTVLYYSADDPSDIPFEDVLVFRTSMYASQRKPHEFAVPGFGDDYIERQCGGDLPVRQKSDRPTVGFCGFGAPPVRLEVLRALAESKEVDTNFIIRPGWWAGTPPRSGSPASVVFAARREFLDNLLASDYALCVRGAGNFSYRLYEALCCGRIPVFVNTDCVLPYDFELEWKDRVVWVEEADIASLPDRVAGFHESLSAADFVDLQLSCRRMWEEWLSPVGFYRNFYRHVLGDADT